MKIKKLNEALCAFMSFPSKYLLEECFRVIQHYAWSSQRQSNDKGLSPTLINFVSASDKNYIVIFYMK